MSAQIEFDVSFTPEDRVVVDEGLRERIVEVVDEWRRLHPDEVVGILATYPE